MENTVHVFEDSKSTAEAVAQRIFELAVNKSNKNDFFNMAVSGGSTPKQLFEVLAEEPYASSIPWQTIRLFWVDERCVEPTDSESNFGMTYDSLLHKHYIPVENIFRMKGEEIPADEIEEYSEILKNELPERNGFPVFDLILLGMGDDGHTASIFPNNLTLLKSEKSVEVATHPISRQKRITLTGKTINNADKVFFLITGSNKAAILSSIIKKTPESLKYPASYVGNYLNEVEFFIDKSASLKI
ncbi:6-phosphogluconolactonase [Paludibacter sp.]